MDNTSLDASVSDGRRHDRRVSSSRRASFTVPGVSYVDATSVAEQLQGRLVSLIDLGLTVRHIQWNMVGAGCAAVRSLLDPQHAGVWSMTDALAERMAALGCVPNGLPGTVVNRRTWDDYGLDRADTLSHLGALDLVYEGVIADHRAAFAAVADVDPVTMVLLATQTGELERFHWLVRAHLADWAGGLANAGVETEVGAARAVVAKSSRNAVRAADPSPPDPLDDSSAPLRMAR